MRGLPAVALLAMLGLAPCAGCGRAWYRRDADRETYTATLEHETAPAWSVPRINITPPPESRLFDPYDPDHPPMPPDDPAAHRYMHRADGHRGWRYWHDDGDAPSVESPAWRAALDLGPDGVLVLTPEKAVLLGQLHSREYQTALEELYLGALALTLNRYDFAVHWFATNNTFYTHFGSGGFPTETNTLSTNTDIGFTKNFAAGAQLLVDFANSFVWEYTGHTSSVTSNLGITFIQPLLRGAGREVRMESLTQGERTLLYDVRAFARFRKDFYFNVASGGGSGFLQLLLQVQNIRNQESNLKSQEQNFRLHEALRKAGSVSSVQEDQAFTSYQRSKAQLIQARTSLENSLDGYKILLGLPPSLPVRLDDAILRPFQLNAPELDTLQEELDTFLAGFREMDQAPPEEALRAGFVKLQTYHQRGTRFVTEIDGELTRWGEALARAAGAGPEATRAKANQEALVYQLRAVAKDMETLGPKVRQAAEEPIPPAMRTAAWEALQRRSRELIAQVAQLFVIQTQARVSLLELDRTPYAEAEAVSYALAHRLDLMNERARVVDAWRQVTVTANALEAGLNVVAGADIANDLKHNNPFNFAAAASTYRVGFQFEAPLSRQIERNNYRAALVNYQRARRFYMAREDGVVQAVRRDLRQLATDRLNFEIARQSLIAAARQVEAARDQLLLADARDTTGTLNILQALDALLAAKNTLIGTWVSYETGRQQLLLDTEALQLDERGLPTDERPADRPGPRSAPGGNEPGPGVDEALPRPAANGGSTKRGNGIPVTPYATPP